VLKDDQKAKWLEQVMLNSFLWQLKACELTDDQQAKLKQACHTFAQEKDAARTIRNKLAQEVFNNILTDNQKKKWLQHDVVEQTENEYYVANLTDNQKAKTQELCAKIIADTVSLATLKDFKDVYAITPVIRKKLKPLVDAMLTNEQKAAMEEARNPKKAAASATSAPATK
jgi:hypothetical protein